MCSKDILQFSDSVLLTALSAHPTTLSGRQLKLNTCGLKRLQQNPSGDDSMAVQAIPKDLKVLLLNVNWFADM